MDTTTDAGRPAAPAVVLTADERAILETVLYSSLFDYPLSAAELRRGLIRSTLDEAGITRACAASPVLQQLVAHRDGLFFPRDRADLPERRHEREPASHAAIAAHARLLRWICAIPFTRLVALSGSAAHLNMNERADVDLFVLAHGRRVWSVVVAVILLARLLRQRQSLCVNYVLSDAEPRLAQDDLYTANQVVSLQPLIGHDALEWLIAQNPFVSSWYPNRSRAPRNGGRCVPGPVLLGAKRVVERLLDLGPAQAFEWAARTLYGGHLARRLRHCASPREVTLATATLKLHANGHRDAVLGQFDHRVRAALRAAGVPDGDRAATPGTGGP